MMTDKQIIIDGKTIGCPCYINRPLRRYDKACLVQSQAFTEQQTEEKPILRCDEIKNCPIKENYKQLKRKEQECEELKKYLHKNFEEKDKLHLIIDRLLEASGYDTNTASAEDFEDVYKNMRYKKQQLEQLGQTLTEIKEVAENSCCLQPTSTCEEYKNCNECSRTSDDETVKQILQKISECEVENDKSNR